MNDLFQYKSTTIQTLILLSLSNKQSTKSEEKIMKNEMYRQAILDAKALRDSAIANAKASLQEAFEPKIQEMLRLKLSEELEEEAEIEEGYNEDGMEEGYHEDGMEEDAPLGEADLDEILAELEALSEEGEEHMEEDMSGMEDLNEAEEDDSEEGEEDESEEGEEVEGDDTEEAVGDETKIVDITLGDLKSVIQDLMANGSESEVEDMSSMDEPTDDEESELSLDEILAELEEEDGDKVQEAKGEVKGYGKVGGKGTTGYDEKVGGKGRTGYDAGSKKLNEANNTIKILSEKLQEINLLNAKLLYMNKILKGSTLSEAQKIRVVKAFDKAESVKEVKNVYEILSESFKASKKAPLKESYGFASKPAGVAPKTPIVDIDPIANRWSQLVFGTK